MGYNKGSEKYIAMTPTSKQTNKQKRSQINSLMLHLKLLERHEQVKTKISREKEVIKIRAKINEIETKIAIKRIYETKSWFFKKKNKIDKSLPI
jgi:hypothetical protein